MRIFYAVQATGNGHISRAMELIPVLQQYGTVDIFLSGDNSHLSLDAPVKYRSRGISLYYTCHGGLDYWQMFRKISLLRVRREIRDLPVEKYDLVLNDFDHITSAACAKKGVPSIHFGHQASFQSAKCPRPERRQLTGEWLLKNYVKAEHHVGLHFESYDTQVLPAIVKKAICEATPTDDGYITIYLPSYCEAPLRGILEPLKAFRFQVFSKETNTIRQDGNITWFPVSRELFNQSLIHCHGIITGAGFETPAEALHLGKKIMVMPIRGQYEQYCNAAALQRYGVPVIGSLDQQFPGLLEKWVQQAAPERKDYSRSVERSLEHIFSLAFSHHQSQVA